MEKKSDKKSIIILLIILAIVTIASGIWTYNTLKPIESQDNFLGFQSNIQIEEVFNIKGKALQNIEDFLEVNEIDFTPGTVWEDFYTDNQFNRLKDIDITIDIDNYTNNPNPFVSPTSTDELGTEGR